MESISKALVLAIQYLGSERNDEDFTEDDDLKVVEDMAAIIQGASENERLTLIRVARELGLNEWASNIGIE
ncbi:hypothetical protein SAMN05660691_04180 [Rheinheimera pacifica]|uniref:Uncharacterized protein n=1 Tax=Rheinheimera pacifica TaxID=173990 RepID=A0A1H6NFW3_9GAMM|nr:hypothetical protein [Rheinheimera pacifica]SEI14212.1 hypothetical protein SAMN05660691_04180 [Rheinheimera pacifica]